MGTTDQKLKWASRSHAAGGILVAAAAAFHFFAAPHLGHALRVIRDPAAYEFVRPILSFTFLLNGVLLLPLSFSTFWCAAGLRRGESWALWIGLVNALAVLALPGLIVATMGLGYFAGAPLFIAGATAVMIAGILMVLPLLWAWRGLPRQHR